MDYIKNPLPGKLWTHEIQTQMKTDNKEKKTNPKIQALKSISSSAVITYADVKCARSKIRTALLKAGNVKLLKP